MPVPEEVALAVTDPYAVETDYFAVFPDATHDDEAELLEQLTAISRYIESPAVCGQFFTKDTAAVVRIFRPEHTSAELWLGTDLAVAPTQIRLDTAADGTYATTLAAAYWELWPLNAADGPEARPWRRIDLVSWGTYTSWAAGQRVEVTAQWGWPAVPAAIRQACIHLTAILRLQSPRATSSVDEIGRVVGMSAEGRGIVESLLRAYPRLPAVG